MPEMKKCPMQGGLGFHNYVLNRDGDAFVCSHGCGARVERTVATSDTTSPSPALGESGR